MQNIYYRNRILSICRKDEIPAITDGKFLMRPAQDYDFSKIPYLMESNTSFHTLFIETPEGISEDELVEKILSNVKQINAAGGIVENNDGKHLMIYRNGVWDLPKGKQEEGEDIAVTAIREVEEECGIKASLGNLLIITRHAYRLESSLIIKSTYWYKMFTESGVHTSPQEEEGIEKCEWVTDDDLDYRLANTYQSIIDVFDALRTDRSKRIKG